MDISKYYVQVGRIGKMKTRSAVLHSTLTKETAVIHASTEEEKEKISFNIIFLTHT